MAKEIITSFVDPPIPMRDMDWCAYYDPESQLYGWGRTEQLAIEDLLERGDENANE